MTSPSADGLISRMRSNSREMSSESAKHDPSTEPRQFYTAARPASHGLLGLLAALHCPQHPFHRRRDPMPDHRQLLAPLARHPVELNHPPLANERQMPMPRLIRPQKRQQRPLRRRHLHRKIIDVRPRPQQPKPSTRLIPRRIDVQQNRHNLTGRVRVNIPIPRPAAPRAVIVEGRSVRSILNFLSNALRNSSLSSASTIA